MQKLAASRWLKVCLIFFIVTIPPFLSGCGSGKALPLFNVAGSWFIYHTMTGTNGEQGPELFTFTQSTNDLTGTTSQNLGLTGTVSGLNIDFSWSGSDGATYIYAGQVSADGTTMSGTWTSNNGHLGTWHGIVNTPVRVDIAGNWNIFNTTTGTPGEQGPDLFAFIQTGNGISGATSQGLQVIGTVSSLSITFFQTGNDGVTIDYTGTVNIAGAAMSGTWKRTNGQSGTWRATKIS